MKCLLNLNIMTDKSQTTEDKGVFADTYARETIDLVADVDIKDDDRNYFPVHPETPLSRKFCKVSDEAEDVRLLCQDCMCHHCNIFCMRDNRKISHAPAMLVLEMRHIMVIEILLGWISEKNQNW